MASSLRRSRGAALLTAAVLVLPLLTGMSAPSPGGTHTPARPRALAAQKPVPVHPVKSRAVHVPALRVQPRPVVSWPAAGTGTATLGAGTPASGAPASGGKSNPSMAGASPGSGRAGTLPVWAGPPAAPAGRGTRAATEADETALPAPGKVRVTMASRKAAAALGVSGVVFTVASASGTAPAARLHVSLDYASFAGADGGDYPARLHLVELPACALTTPQLARCRVQTPLASADDVATSRLGADLALPAVGPDTVVAATTAPSGSAGSYSATPLSEAGAWSGGDSSGTFTYSYPISAPPVPGGLAPQVSLGYSSQAVDGLTSASNNQASWIGDGWDYQPGYIEQDFPSCGQQTSLPSSEQTGDLCYSSSRTMSLSLNGQQTTLVDDSSTGWHAEADGGERIAYKTGTVNGTQDGDYWVVTDPDGTSYYFGLNQLPGYASGDPGTNSAWTAPVYATASGQPCYSSTFASSHCAQAWRWNLDYVTDSHGDAMAFFYNTETNYYAADKGTSATAAYTQAGALSKIEYGLRAGSVYGTTPAAQVTFTTASDRTDVPASGTGDLACSSGATCDVQSPTFWSRYRLTTIATEALKGSTLEPVDSWALAQDYPDLGDATSTPSLWLDSITRTGQDGTAVSLPPVKFGGTAMANRVESTADLNDGYSIITRVRMTAITSETGGVTTVTYDSAPSSCTSGNFPAPDANTTLCYPDYWTPPGAAGPVEDWFNKYVVTGVTQENTVGGGQPVTTQYSYAGAAWHYDDDTLTRSAQRTWDQWRGFRTVTTETGTSPDPITKKTDTFFQGMDGDYQSGGGTSSVSLTSTEGGETVTDSDQFAGQTFEAIVDDGSGGGAVTDTVTVPWTSAATATQSQPAPLPSLRAFLTGTAETKVFTALAEGGNRESDTTYTHDSYGRVTTQSSVPDTSDASEDTCTSTSYASNTSSWLLDLPAEVTVVSVPCGTSASLPAGAVSDTQTYYDGATTVGAAPSAGDATMTRLATSYSGSTPTFTTQSTDTFDEYGRTLTAADADNRTTTTSYTPAAGAEPTSVTVTDPMGLATTTTYDPARDLPLTVTNPANWTTAETYDALGRLTAVWKPGHPQGTVPADETFSYTVSDTAASVVTTSTITDTGGYLPTETLYDSLGRAAETQAETPDGNRDITDTYYDSDGWQVLVSSAYYTTGTPNDKLESAPDGQVPSQTGYVYDGDGRVTKQISYKFAAETWETDTSYGGDYTTVVPPAGGTTQTTFTNGEGDTSAIDQYHSGVPANPSDPGSDYDQTGYTYTPSGKLATISDAAGSKWAYGYDLAGDQVSASDPDTGNTTSSYDPAGQLLTTTDARGKQASYSYDADGRRTAEYDTTGGAAPGGSDELASWTYDTLAKGQLTSSTSYVGGTSGSAYTEGVLGYNSYGLPTGTETVIPSSAGALAGTYKQADAYGAYGDLMSSYYDYAAAGLPNEQVDLGYDAASDPVSLGSPLWFYVASLSYTELGQPHEYTLGTTNYPAWMVDGYDQETNRLTSTEVQAGTGSPQTVDATSYGYDNDGNITSEADAPANGPSQVQCYQYDYLGRLTQAWAQGSSGCASTPSQSAEGGAAPYWESYQYNDQNDLTAETSTPPSGAATATTDSYPSAGSAQPHAVTSQQVAAPSGTSATSYSYNADGDATSISPSAGATQNLNWNDAGQLASITTAGTGGTTGYVYDAGGNLLLQTDPGSETLYLPDEQLVLNTATGQLSGTRYYSIGGVTVAARTSNGDVQYLAGDQQGTDTVAIDYSSLNVTRRYYDPYGNPIGAAPSSWPGTRGFVGGTADTSTGLTNLGAREYNPETGAFVSPDSLISPYDPQDLNAYAYASDSPATDSDPTGQMVCEVGASCGSVQSFTSPSGPNHRAGETDISGPASDSYSSSSPGYYGPIGDIHNTAFPHSDAPAPPPVKAITDHVVSSQQPSAGALSMGCASPAFFRFGACPGAMTKMPKDPAATRMGGWQFAISAILAFIPGPDVLDGAAVADGADAAPGLEGTAPEGAPQAQEIIQSTARAQAARGADYLKGWLSPPEQAAMEADSGLTSRMLGQAVHRATADALDQEYPGRFIYRTRGIDFVDTTTGEALELTTPGEVAGHLARPGYGLGVTMCTYVLPTC